MIGLDKAEPTKQMCKAIEELGELAAAIVRDDIEEQIDAIGDIMVVLTVLGMQLHLDITGCYFLAYQQIKDRKGQMVNGIFVKENDLKISQRIMNAHVNRRRDSNVRVDENDSK